MESADGDNGGVLSRAGDASPQLRQGEERGGPPGGDRPRKTRNGGHRMNDQDRRTELEKLEAGDVYCFLDPEVVARKESAVVACRRFNDADPADSLDRKSACRERV